MECRWYPYIESTNSLMVRWTRGTLPNSAFTNLTFDFQLSQMRLWPSLEARLSTFTNMHVDLPFLETGLSTFTNATSRNWTFDFQMQLCDLPFLETGLSTFDFHKCDFDFRLYVSQN